jgi:nucleotide-binding universal stress UspA family protein
VNLRRILFATDFSAASETALEYAVALARDSGATLLLVHVEEPQVSYPGGELVYVYAEQPNPVVRQMLEARVSQVGNIPHELFLESGHAADEIVRLAEEQKADLIVLGTHGRRGLVRLLMGSVAELVMRRAACPVLAVKAAVGAKEN